jgi:hypothetical protein
MKFITALRSILSNVKNFAVVLSTPREISLRLRKIILQNFSRARVYTCTRTLLYKPVREKIPVGNIFLDTELVVSVANINYYIFNIFNIFNNFNNSRNNKYHRACARGNSSRELIATINPQSFGGGL